MRALLLIGVCVLLVGCNTTPPEVQWFTKTSVDQFTDEASCTVSLGSIYYSDGSVYTLNNHVYPAVHIDSNGVFVGAISGGKILIPVGDLRIRIDSNEPWILRAAENPKTSLKVDGPVSQAHFNAYTQSLTNEQKQQAQATYDTAMSAAANMMLPYTFTGGEEAQRLLSEMKTGNQIKLQRIALGNATSTVGTHNIDQSFHDSLAKCQSFIK